MTLCRDRQTYEGLDDYTARYDLVSYSSGSTLGHNILHVRLSTMKKLVLFITRIVSRNRATPSSRYVLRKHENGDLAGTA